MVEVRYVNDDTTSWCSYRGRNRHGTARGIDLTAYADKVRLSPINSRGSTDACHIDVPRSMIGALIEALQDV